MQYAEHNYVKTDGPTIYIYIYIYINIYIYILYIYIYIYILIAYTFKSGLGNAAIAADIN